MGQLNSCNPKTPRLLYTDAEVDMDVDSDDGLETSGNPVQLSPATPSIASEVTLSYEKINSIVNSNVGRYEKPTKNGRFRLRLNMSRQVYDVLESGVELEAMCDALIELTDSDPHIVCHFMPNHATKASLHGALGTLQLPLVVERCVGQELSIRDAARIVCEDKPALCAYLRDQFSDSMEKAATFLNDPRNGNAVDVPERYAIAVEDLPFDNVNVVWVKSETAFGYIELISWQENVRHAVQSVIVSQQDAGIVLVAVNELSLEDMTLMRKGLCLAVIAATTKARKHVAVKVVAKELEPVGMEYTYVVISGLPYGMSLTNMYLLREVSAILKVHGLTAMRLEHDLEPAKHWYNDGSARYMSVLVEIQPVITNVTYHQGTASERAKVSSEYHCGTLPLHKPTKYDMTKTKYRLIYLTRRESRCWGSQCVGYVIRHLGIGEQTTREKLVFIKKKLGGAHPNMVLIPYVVRMVDTELGAIDMEQIAVTFPQSDLPRPDQRRYQFFGVFAMEIHKTVSEAFKSNIGILDSVIWMGSPQNIMYLTNVSPSVGMDEILKMITSCVSHNAIYGMRIDCDVFVLLEGLTQKDRLKVLPLEHQLRFAKSGGKAQSMIRVEYQRLWPGEFPRHDLRWHNISFQMRLLQKKEVEKFNASAAYMELFPAQGVCTFDPEVMHHCYGSVVGTNANPFGALADNHDVSRNLHGQLYAEVVRGGGEGSDEGAVEMSGVPGGQLGTLGNVHNMEGRTPSGIGTGIGLANQTRTLTAIGSPLPLSNVR